MACYSPITGYMAKTPNATGKRSIVFNRSAGFIDKEVQLPCGNCIGCRIDKSRMWAIRCVHESKMHKKNCFVTLTYKDEELPEDMSLNKKHLQDFFKRLRANYGPFRYYASGEYGDNTKRPHYHVLFFGIDFSEDRKKFSQSKNGDTTYKSELLSRTWGFGLCDIGSFNYSSAAYVARYIVKKMSGDFADSAYSRYDSRTGECFRVAPEFSLMSRNPGIGSTWYDKYKTDVFPSDFLVHKGKKHPVPRYYADKLQKEEKPVYENIKLNRKIAQLKEKPNNTPDRLAVRETCKKAQIKQLTRSL
ncbi:MAG: replication initiator protein [Microviridae sp.]|nr:MAG: replication initiator protein [Microviridae sp.]